MCWSCGSLDVSENVRDFNDTQSANYGSNIVDEDNVVSLECGIEPNFELESSLFVERSQGAACDSIQIENVSSDKDIDQM